MTSVNNHGTHAGFLAHARRGETPCDPCRLAHNTYRNELRAKKPKKGRPVPQCGTYSGYQAHVRRKETPCPPCRESKNAYLRARRAGDTKKLSIPVHIITELYLSAPIELQIALEQSLGTARIDRLVARFDAEVAS
ncbi:MULTISPECIES: hypothetical protein [Rhodococcus]|uniref:hypothetical protein n=1 Tax=Rhodococcus TaxID=1827 RepID=UPI000C7D55A2|nr:MULTISPECIES: hypothetical protein [Rhodococcus]AUM18275.1 hypothetical protein CSW53_18135 [Rhodococcus ruber]